VPASPKLGCLLFVLAGAASACSSATTQRAPRAAAPSADSAAAPVIERELASARFTDRSSPERDQLDRTVAALAVAAEKTGFTDLNVLVELSARQIERASVEGGPRAEEDLASAEANLGRVLAIDEHSPSASNQLALLHLAKAKRLGRPELERAMGVCLWATRENPTFAPLHNTVGLVELELRDVVGAIRSFETAVKLDPSYFADAERVYDRMIAERPEYAKEIRQAKQRVHDLGGALP
jgi:tetratricopeptide (TPR) repeat protein